jgi:hypothetical protein
LEKELDSIKTQLENMNTCLPEMREEIVKSTNKKERRGLKPISYRQKPIKIQEIVAILKIPKNGE